MRHGQTEANLRGVFCGLTDLALTPLGVEQAGDIASWLADVAFADGVSSQLLRARHTADIVLAGHPLNAGINDQLNEMNFGEWEMRHHHDLQREDPDAWAAWVTDWQQASPTGGGVFYTVFRPSRKRRSVTAFNQQSPNKSSPNKQSR